MTSLTVAAGTVNQTPVDWDGNTQNIIGAIEAAKKGGAQLLCLPELCVTGYGCEDLFFSPAVRRSALSELEKILPHTNGIAVGVGLPVEFESEIYNCVALLAEGKLVGLTAKKNLAGDGVHYEPRWFKPWPVGAQQELLLFGRAIPFGDVWYQLGDITFGFEICHDAWVQNRHAIDLATRGANIILNPSASHCGFGKRATIENLVRTATREHTGAYVFANLSGCESGRTIYGGDCIIATQDTIIASAARFSMRSFGVTCATLNEIQLGLDTRKVGFFSARKHPPVTVPASTERRSIVVAAQPEADPCSTSESIMLQNTRTSLRQLEEFSAAITLGLFDYARKAKSCGFTVSLSGGADSSACAVLVACALKRAIATLGVAAVRKVFSLPAGDTLSLAEILTCVYQSTENSSEDTKTSALALCNELSIPLHTLDIDPVVTQYKKMAEEVLKRPLTWEKDSLTLQNIQARVRSPSIWMIANAKNQLLLTTSNRSESVVGYATMDGDTSGGLAPLAGIDKDFLQRWLTWMEQHGGSWTGSFKSLAAVNALAPTAELKPLSAKQTDEGDLMPYSVLASLERSAVRYHRSPEEAYLQLKESFGTQFNEAQLRDFTKKFYRLWLASQWKRERIAPGFHIDDFSVDPKSWCRIPILNGGWKIQ